jgi:hypothetical protein
MRVFMIQCAILLLFIMTIKAIRIAMIVIMTRQQSVGVVISMEYIIK